MSWCVTLCDMNQLLLDNLQLSRGQAVIGLSVGEFQSVAQERNACFGLMSKVVGRVSGNDHLRNKLHVVGVATAYVVEQVPYLSSTAVLIEDRGGRLQERVVGALTGQVTPIHSPALVDLVGRVPGAPPEQLTGSQPTTSLSRSGSCTPPVGPWRAPSGGGRCSSGVTRGLPVGHANFFRAHPRVGRPRAGA